MWTANGIQTFTQITGVGIVPHTRFVFSVNIGQLSGMIVSVIYAPHIEELLD